MKNILVEARHWWGVLSWCAIYDLNQFLNCLSLIPGSELKLEEDSIVITDGTNSIDYRYSDPSVISAPPEKELKLPSEDVCVVLTEENLETVKKAAAVLQIPDVSLVGDGEKIELTVRDKKNSGSNSYRIEVGETDTVFQFNLKVENLKLLGGDYDVTISSKNLAKFESHGRPLVYFIAIEPDSTYGWWIRFGTIGPRLLVSSAEPDCDRTSDRVALIRTIITFQVRCLSLTSL